MTGKPASIAASSAFARRMGGSLRSKCSPACRFVKGLIRRQSWQEFWQGIPLAKQVFLAMFCSMAVMTSLYSVVDVYMSNRRFSSMESATMESIFPVLRRIIEDSMLRRTRGHIRDLFLPPGQRNPPERMLLLDTDKNTVDLDELAAGLPPRHHPTPTLPPERFLVMDFAMRAKPACYQCHTPGKDPLGYVRIVSDHPERMKAAAAHFKMHLTLLAFNMIAMGLLALWIVRRFIGEPVGRLLGAMNRVAEGRFDTRIKDFPAGELRDIASGFNSMLGTIEEDRRQIVELHRRQVAHMERLVAVGEVAAHLAHEVRNPLTGIGNAVQILQQETPPDNPRHELFGKILSQLNRMDHTMANFLSFARMPEAVTRPFDLKESLNRVTFLIEPRLKSQKIELRLRWPQRLPMILGDPRQMEQVFLNLCLNAIQAMPSGGILTLTASREKESAILLTFTDTGGGIPSTHLEQVFRPFFTTKEKGSGLGLPIVKQIVMSRNGEVWIASAPGQGTSVYVRLPVRDGDPA